VPFAVGVIRSSLSVVGEPFEQSGDEPADGSFRVQACGDLGGVDDVVIELTMNFASSWVFSVVRAPWSVTWVAVRSSVRSKPWQYPSTTVNTGKSGNARTPVSRHIGDQR
jgi:hypothetical protein